MRVMTLILFGYLYIAAGGAQGPRCLPYEPKSVTLDGVVYAKDFPGPPNYESFRRGDQRMRYWILRLGKPICVEGPPDQIDVREDNIREIQLVFRDDSFYKRYRSWIKRRARFRVNGTLYHRHTGHHVRTILITVQSFVPQRS